MTPVLIGKGLLFEGSNSKIEDKQVPGIYIYIHIYVYLHIIQYSYRLKFKPGTQMACMKWKIWPMKWKVNAQEKVSWVLGIC